jgi:hypothetical protein
MRCSLNQCRAPLQAANGIVAAAASLRATDARVCCCLLQDQNGLDLGVAGSMQQLSNRTMSSQPINSFDWSRDKSGLFVCSAFDQCIRVGFVTKLNKL